MKHGWQNSGKTKYQRANGEMERIQIIDKKTIVRDMEERSEKGKQNRMAIKS